jgi:steroid delta-isomerase-like uncharacterized protein
MTTVTTTDLGIALVDALNSRNFDSWTASVSDDFVANYPGAAGLNATAARSYNETFLTAFPDLHFDVIHRLSDGEITMTTWVGKGTHQAPLATPAGVIPATGRTGEVRGVLVTTVRGGRMVQEDTYWNQIELLAQLGVA